jgi:hypothetical protein
MATSNEALKTEETKAKKMHWVLCTDSDRKKPAEDWVGLMTNLRGKNYRSLDLKGLGDIGTSDVLYIHTHGYIPNKAGEQAVSVTQSRRAERYTAKAFAEFLIKNNLNREHRTLKIAACYTDTFAKELQEALSQRGYRNITVYGYRGEVVLAQGKKGGKLAGLVEPYIVTDGHHMRLDSVKIAQPGVLDYFRAKNHRVAYGPNAPSQKVQTSQKEKLFEELVKTEQNLKQIKDKIEKSSAHTSGSPKRMAAPKLKQQASDLETVIKAITQNLNLAPELRRSTRTQSKTEPSEIPSTGRGKLPLMQPKKEPSDTRQDSKSKKDSKIPASNEKTLPPVSTKKDPSDTRQDSQNEKASKMPASSEEKLPLASTKKDKKERALPSTDQPFLHQYNLRSRKVTVSDANRSTTKKLPDPDQKGSKRFH